MAVQTITGAATNTSSDLTVTDSIAVTQTAMNEAIETNAAMAAASIASGDGGCVAPPSSDFRCGVPPLEMTDRHVELTGPGGVLDNDLDSDGDALRVVGFVTDEGGRTEKGQVWLEADGSAHYQADEGAKGKDVVEYVVADGKGGTDTAKVTIDLGDGLRNHTPDAKDDVIALPPRPDPTVFTGDLGPLRPQPGGNTGPLPPAEPKVAIDEIKAEIKEAKAEIRAEIKEAKAEIRAEIKEAKTEVKAEAKTEVKEAVKSTSADAVKVTASAQDAARAEGIAKGIAQLVADASLALKDGVVSDEEKTKLHEAAATLAKLTEPHMQIQTNADGGAIGDAKAARDDLASSSSKAMSDGKFTDAEIKDSMAKVDAMMAAIDQAAGGAKGGDGGSDFLKKLSAILAQFVGVGDQGSGGDTSDTAKADDKGAGLMELENGNYLYGLGNLINAFERNSKQIIS